MTKQEELSEWLDKIEKNGIPQNDVFRMLWEDIIKTLRKRESWESIEEYIKENKEEFSGDSMMAGPHAANKIFNQISVKIWSINKQSQSHEK